MSYTNLRAQEKYAARVYAHDPELRLAYLARNLGKRSRKRQRDREHEREKEERNHALRQYRHAQSQDSVRSHAPTWRTFRGDAN